MHISLQVLRTLIAILVLGGALLLPAEARVKVASLHPMVTDLARQVGGDRVDVIALMAPGEDPHDFQPTSADMTSMRAARLVLVSGKRLETYLDNLKAGLATGQEVVEVGRPVPSCIIEAGSLFVCCPAHSTGSIDPHWWHSVKGTKRAVDGIAKEFARVDPAGAAIYKANAKAYERRLDELYSWAKRELGQIPRSQRKLATAHAAFGYFCRDFGFRAVPIYGLDRSREVSSQYLSETIETIRKEKITVVFPEELANPKALDAIVRATGVRKGPALIADGSRSGVTSYEAFIRHNINAVVAALR